MPVENCPRCNGTGWEIVEREGISAARACDCVSNDRAREIEEGAGIPPLYRQASIHNFAVPDDNPSARNQLQYSMTLVRTYANQYPAVDKPGLLLIGEPGTGKTHLAVAALRILISRGFAGVFYDFQMLLEKIRSGYDPSSGSSAREAYQAVLDAEILLLDDLGAHRMTEWVEDTVTFIVTHRCNNKRPLIATTNLPDEDAGSVVAGRTTLAQRIGVRARSRLFEMCRIVRMPLVEDYRIRKSR